MWIPHLNSPRCSILAPISAIVGVGIGAGLTYYQRWALTIAALERIIPLVELIVFSPVVYALDHGALWASITSSQLKTTDIVFVLLMAIYLFNPKVRRHFGIS